MDLPEASGGAARIADGHPQAIAFLATYCLPCIAQLRPLADLHEAFAPRGLEVLSVFFDTEGEAVVQPFAERYHLPFPALIAGDEIASGRSPLGRVPELPATLFLDRAGRPVASVSGLADLPLLARAAEAALR